MGFGSKWRHPIIRDYSERSCTRPRPSSRASRSRHLHPRSQPCARIFVFVCYDQVAEANLAIAPPASFQVATVPTGSRREMAYSDGRFEFYKCQITGISTTDREVPQIDPGGSGVWQSGKDPQTDEMLDSVTVDGRLHQRLLLSIHDIALHTPMLFLRDPRR